MGLSSLSTHPTQLLCLVELLVFWQKAPTYQLKEIMILVRRIAVVRGRGWSLRPYPLTGSSQGWISIKKNRDAWIGDQELRHCNLSCWRSCNRATSNDRISLSTLKEGTSVHNLRDRCKGRQIAKGNSRELQGSWLFDKIKVFGEVVRLSVDSNKGGWTGAACMSLLIKGNRRIGTLMQ